MIKKLTITTIFSIISIFTPVLADNNSSKTSQSDNSFQPIWRLLNQENKQQFVSGYQHGWQDAVKIIDIVITYLKDNPTEGEKSLESIKSIYDISSIKPEELVKALDRFYADPQNNNAPFSKAITAAKNNKK